MKLSFIGTVYTFKVGGRGVLFWQPGQKSHMGCIWPAGLNLTNCLKKEGHKLQLSDLSVYPTNR